MRYAIFIVCLLFSNTATGDALDLSVELMRARAYLDRAIEDTGPIYYLFEEEVAVVNKGIKDLTQQLRAYEEKAERDLPWEVSFKRKIVCLRLSIDSVYREIIYRWLAPIGVMA